jgi:hypothetical protein
MGTFHTEIFDDLVLETHRPTIIRTENFCTYHRRLYILMANLFQILNQCKFTPAYYKNTKLMGLEIDIFVLRA